MSGAVNPGALRRGDGVGRMMPLSVWRHPLPRGAAGRCIGRTDLPVDRRKSKRLAHRIRAHARRCGWPAIVVTSPLSRSRDVGHWLAAWGWRHRIDPRLIEFDFGAWDGARWADIGAGPLDAWIADFAAHRPGGGESVAELLGRCADFIADPARSAACAVGHAGWISAAAWWTMAGAPSRPTGPALALELARLPTGAPAVTPTAEGWPAPLGYGRRFDCILPDEPVRAAAARSSNRLPPRPAAPTGPARPAGAPDRSPSDG